MDNSTNNTITYNAGLRFDHYYIEHKSYYMAIHGCIPNLSAIHPLHAEKAFKALQERYGDSILQVHTSRWFKARKRDYQTSRLIIRMKEPVTIEFCYDNCEILHDGTCDAFIAELTTLLKAFMERPRREPREIHLIVPGEGGLELRAMEVKRSKLDIGLYYEDDFAAVDATIRRRLARKNDKGIILLHGLPGTGKTSYLRYLAGRIRKQVLFLSPSVAGNLMDPSFIQLLIDHPNSVIIEDAEEIITDRRLGGSSAVSNLLNISDGLLADFLNVQLICTFNSPLTMVDSALMRKGRLIAKYALDKLSVEKAQRLSDHAGFEREITEPMTVAEIMNPHEEAYTPDRREIIGFRRGVYNN